MRAPVKSRVLRAELEKHYLHLPIPEYYELLREAQAKLWS